MRLRLVLTALLCATALALPAGPARADIAPPKMPPGATLLPGQEQTQVRMASETVTLAVSKDPADPNGAIARTDAVFTMRNLGSSEEQMAVRFPLSFFNGSSDGRDAFPEIPSITAKVDGKRVPVTRELQPPYEPSPYGSKRADIPWAVFDVAFPPAQDVTVEVVYTVKSYGYYPQAIFDYILETGAGWNGTIGSADIIVALPYAASESNVLIDQSSLAETSTPGGVINGNEVRWHFADFEPTAADNFEVILLTPSLWQSILNGMDAVKSSPKDGEAWGMLAKAYKQAALLPKGWVRDDPAGQQLMQLSEQAYQKCVTLLPKDALWHYGYADALWSDYYFNYYSHRRPDTQGLLPSALHELQQTVSLDPSNALAKDLLITVQMAVPGSVKESGGSYDFLALTATPPMPTLYPGTPTDTPQAVATASRASPSSTTLPSQPVTAAPSGGAPICGGSFLLLGLPSLGLFLRRARGHAGG